MSAMTNAEISALAASGQENFVPAAEEARPHTFLTLAPTTSASYPVKSVAVAVKTPDETQESIDNLLLKTRRSSSLDSTNSSKQRFLKLGPVHFGEGDGDWSEEVLAE